MYRQHVYVDANKLTTEFMQQKYAITQQPGARYAPAAFVTGTLDSMQSHDEFLQIGQSVTDQLRCTLSIPVLVVIGEHSPPQSKTEMEALAALSAVQAVTLPRTLGMHEEYAIAVADALLPFLKLPQQ